MTGELFGIHDYLAFILAGIALNLVPGQDTLYILGRSISQGRLAGVVSVIGISSGCIIHILLAACGIYAVLALWPVAFTVIVVLGGLYLIWLGISTWLHRKNTRPGEITTISQKNLWLVYRQGFLTNLLNPKVALFFLAFLPGFIDPAVGYGALSFLILGGTFLFTGTVWCLIVALCAAAFADALRGNPKIQTGFEIFTSLLFFGLGAGILLAHL